MLKKLNEDGERSFKQAGLAFQGNQTDDVLADDFVPRDPHRPNILKNPEKHERIRLKSKKKEPFRFSKRKSDKPETIAYKHDFKDDL